MAVFVSQEAILSIGSSMTAVEFRDSVNRALHLAVPGIVSHTVCSPSICLHVHLIEILLPITH